MYTEKRCTKCNYVKTNDNFHTRSGRANEYQSWCKECCKEYNRSSRAKELRNDNPERRRQIQNASRKRNPETYIVKECRRRAKDKNLDFELTKKDIIIPKFCPVLGIELDNSHENKDFHPSIDRIDNTKGYTVGNIIIVSYRVNRIKNDSTEEERRLVYEFCANRPPYIFPSNNCF